jgi:hypothetical protein
MNMTLGLVGTLSILALAGGLSALGLGLWRMWRAAQAPKAADERIADLIREGNERLGALMAMMDASTEARLDALRAELSSVKADLDWLTGERMIEQAIAMARDGVSAEEISADLGLSLDAAETVQAMRRH